MSAMNSTNQDIINDKAAMDSTKTPTVYSVLPAALAMSLSGWGGLAWLITSTLPVVGPRWGFFFLATMAATGTALPFAALLNQRFPSQPPVSLSTVLRQAVWVGVYFSTLAWLQIGRVLSLPIVLLLGLGFVAIEWLLRLRERSLWKP